MKILIANNLYKPYNKGGAEKIVEFLFDAFDRQDHEILLLTTKPYKGKAADSDQKIYYINSLYYDLSKIPIFIRLFWHFFDLFDFIKYYQIKKILLKEKPDLVIGLNLKGITYLLPILAKKLKIKYCHYPQDVQLIAPSGLIIHGHEEKINGLFNKLYISICRNLFKDASYVIFSSLWLKTIHESKNFFNKAQKIVINNPVYISEAKILDPRSDDFLFVGQIEEHKGIIFLIDLFVRLYDQKEIYNLKIAGSGSCEALIKARSTPNIKLLGRMEPNEIRNVMAYSLALIVPSLCYENSPFVIYEAAQVGLPTIASDIGGITELTQKIGGFLFKPGDSQGLRNILVSIMQGRSKLEEIRQNSTRSIRDYSLENYTQKIISFLAK